VKQDDKAAKNRGKAVKSRPSHLKSAPVPNPLSQPLKYLRENVFEWKQDDVTGLKGTESARSIRRMERSHGPFSLKSPSLASVIRRFKDESQSKTFPLVKRELLQNLLEESQCEGIEDYLLQGYSDSDLEQSPYAYVAIHRRLRRGVLASTHIETVLRLPEHIELLQKFPHALGAGDVICHYESDPITLPTDLERLVDDRLPRILEEKKNVTIDFNDLYSIRKLIIRRPQQEERARTGRNSGSGHPNSSTT
jgi:hypothetical protein